MFSHPLGNYSIAVEQIVAIARAIDLFAKVLILDEPTASLDAKEVEMLLDILRKLRDRAIGMIFVTHFLDQVYCISDRITILRNGRLVGTLPVKELLRIELVQMMLGHSFDETLLKRGEHRDVAGDAGFAKLGNGTLFYLPMPVVIACVVLLALWILTCKKARGLFIESVGINLRSARNAGVSTTLVLIAAYVIAACVPP